MKKWSGFYPNIATILNSLANVYLEEAKYEQAEPLLKRALAIQEKVLGHEHPDTANSLNHLAILYSGAQGKLDDTELLNKQSLTTREQVVEPEHSDVINSLYKRATLYHEQNNYDEAELLYKQALDISERTLGSEHLEVAKILSDLGGLYYDQDKYYQAEPLFRRALTICERTWNLTISLLPSASITWQLSTMLRGSIIKPSRSINVRLLFVSRF